MSHQRLDWGGICFRATCLLAALRSWQVVGLSGSVNQRLPLVSCYTGPVHVAADLIEAMDEESQ